MTSNQGRPPRKPLQRCSLGFSMVSVSCCFPIFSTWPEQCLTIRKGVQDFNEPNSVSAAQSAAQSHQVETVERVWLLILASVSPSLWSRRMVRSCFSACCSCWSSTWWFSGLLSEFRRNAGVGDAASQFFSGFLEVQEFANFECKLGSW